MTVSAIDPGLLRELGRLAGTLADCAETTAQAVADITVMCMLDQDVSSVCTQLALDAQLLDELAHDRAHWIEVADSGWPLDAGLLASIAGWSASLGVSGTPTLIGDDAIAALTAHFDQIDGNSDGVVSRDELEAAAANSRISADARRAAQYLLANQGLADNLASVSAIERWYDDALLPDLPYGAFTKDGLRALLAQNEILALISKPDVFKELESAVNGMFDGRLSGGDLQAIVDNPAASADARSVATFLLANPASMAWFDQGSQSSSGPIGFASGADGIISIDDVLALTVGQHVFANNPAGARTWTLGLANRATWWDVSGKTSGIDIRLSTDDGLRALAAAAIADADTLAEQVAVVATMPESRGGVRNQLITFYYAELAGQMNERLNVGLDASDPTAPRHTGANWMQFAPWASNSIGPAIRGELSVYNVIDLNWSDRQYAADGNQYIFGDVAVRYAEFLKAFPADKPIDASGIEEFFEQEHPLASRKSLFEDGHQQLRNSFAYYLAAIEETDPVLRQELTMQGNILIATHEQAGAQHALAGLTDLDVGDDGVMRGFFGEFGALFRGGDEDFATGEMRLYPGVNAEGGLTGVEAIEMDEDVPYNADAENNLIHRASLTGVLNPEHDWGVTVGDIRVGFDTPGDVRLDPLKGWSDPPDGSDRFPTDVAEWAPDDDQPGKPRDDADSPTSATATSNWAAKSPRQWFIANMFQQMHTDTRLFDGLDDLTLDSAWGEPLDEYLPRNVRDVTE